jgi:uncharacterized protein involved in response to NO
LDLVTVHCFLLAVIGIPFVRFKNILNYVFPLVLGVMSLANAEVNLRQLGFVISNLPFGINFMPNFIMLMLVLMGGRPIPFFTRSSLPDERYIRTPMTILAFALLNVAALLRVAVPVFFVSNYGSWILLSGSLCILAFVFFLWDYFPILIAPRIDGRPG